MIREGPALHQGGEEEQVRFSWDMWSVGDLGRVCEMP